jgi:hypothetical protein
VNPEQVVDYLSSGGLLAVSIIILYGLAKQWWVPGWLFRRECAEKDEWKAIALEGTSLGKRSLSVTELAVRRALEGK